MMILGKVYCPMQNLSGYWKQQFEENYFESSILSAVYLCGTAVTIGTKILTSDKSQPIPRHKEIEDGLAIRIIKRLS